MKKYIAIILLIACITATFAKTESLLSSGKSQQSANKDLLIKLYEEPKSDSAVISEVPVNADLVAIYHKGSWVKVGDRANGITG